MRKYIEDLLEKYFDGEKQEGKSPKCESNYTYGPIIRLSFSESVLYSYITPIAYKDDGIIYILLRWKWDWNMTFIIQTRKKKLNNRLAVLGMNTGKPLNFSPVKGK